jgi:carboxyl-terminal processing protease
MSEQKKKISIWLPVLLSVVMIVGMTIGYQLRDNTAGGKFLGFSGRSSVQELVSLINSKYVDPVASDSINQLVADALLSHLDPHSAYIPASDLAEVNDDIAGSFMGIERWTFLQSRFKSGGSIIKGQRFNNTLW